MVIINFIRDRNVGIFARVKRSPRGTKLIAPPTVELDGGCADNAGEGAIVCRPETKEQQGDTVRRRK
jgi:hypothetical protein